MANYKYTITVAVGKEKRVSYSNDLTVARNFCLQQRGVDYSEISSNTTGQLLFYIASEC